MAVAKKPAKRVTSNNFAVAPKSNMNVGKSNLTPAQMREVASKQSKTDKAIGTAAQMLVPGMGGARIGAAVGKGIARAATAATAKNVRSNALKSAGKTKSASSIARPQAPKGKTYKAEAGKTVSVKGSTGVARVKPQGSKPSARVVGRGTDLAKVDQGVRSGNNLRRANAMETASKAERAYVKAASKKNQTAGKVIGGVTGGAAGAAAVKKTKKK